MNASAPFSRLSTDTLHATCVARDGRAVLLTGVSGSGKSDLALRLLQQGFSLVSDDQTVIKRDGDRLLATAPTSIAGKLEVRGIGIVEMEMLSDVPVALIVELLTDMERLPDDGRARDLLGISIPLVTIDARTASAPAKVIVALNHMGLKL